MITYNWDIKFKPTASINGYDNVVLAVIWVLEAQNDENKIKSSMAGTTFFLPPTDTFIPYEDLTDEIRITSSVSVIVASMACGSLNRRATRLRLAFSRRSRNLSDSFISSLVRVTALLASLSKAASVSKIEGTWQG